MAIFVRVVRNIFSPAIFPYRLNDRCFAPSAARTIHNADLHSLSVVEKNFTEPTNDKIRSETTRLCFPSSTSASHKLRYRRLAPVRVRKTPARIHETNALTHNTAVELALNSVVKIFTVSCSPNYLLPWQNKGQRETMGSGQFYF